MFRRPDVEYVIDSKGRRKAVIMSLKAFERLIEDLDDLQCIEDRRHETAVSLESVIADLKDAGRLPG